MVYFSLSSLVLAVTAIAGVFATPVDVTNGVELMARSGTPSSNGTSNGFFYSWWTDGAGTATYTNGAAGKYTLTWSGGNGNLVGGKGWMPGTTSR